MEKKKERKKKREKGGLREWKGKEREKERKKGGEVGPTWFYLPGCTVISYSNELRLLKVLQIGFTFKRRTTKMTDNKVVRYLILACSREGYRRSKKDTLEKTNPTSVASCQARITITMDKSGYLVITRVVLEHSHAVSPSRVRSLRANRVINMHAKRMIDINENAGVRTNYQSLVHSADGYEEVGFNEKDLRNYVIKNSRTIREEGDAECLIDYFTRMTEQNRNFFYDVMLDEHRRIKHVFWADARSRAASQCFGDVVCFDTTYRTNRYEMPFASFVGVNHHGQSVLLGCALLGCEETDAFVWLFNSWTRCMGGIPPLGIITYQCKAMKNAIEKTWPNTRHRWCIWHIMKKIPQKLAGYCSYREISSELSQIVWNSLTVLDFEGKWIDLIERHHLGENDWLKGLFEERHKWVLAFMKTQFWAGMSSTQRSEGMHAFMKNYLTPKSNLEQFVRQFDNCLAWKANKEREADNEDFHTIVPCATNSLIEKQFQTEYTHSKFAEVQSEFRAKANCSTREVRVDGNIRLYEVSEKFELNGGCVGHVFKVSYDVSSFHFWCDCLLFEFRGIICRHSLCVLHMNKVKEVLEKYVLSRWSKNVSRVHSRIKCSHDSTCLEPNVRRYDAMCKKFYNIAEVACNSVEFTDTINHVLDEA